MWAQYSAKHVNVCRILIYIKPTPSYRCIDRFCCHSVGIGDLTRDWACRQFNCLRPGWNGRKNRRQTVQTDKNGLPAYPRQCLRAPWASGYLDTTWPRAETTLSDKEETFHVNQEEDVWRSEGIACFVVFAVWGTLLFGPKKWLITNSFDSPGPSQDLPWNLQWTKWFQSVVSLLTKPSCSVPFLYPNHGCNPCNRSFRRHLHPPPCKHDLC